ATEPQRKRGKETVEKSSFLFLLCVSVSLWPFLRVLTLPDLDRGELDGALVRAGKTDDQNIAFAQMRGDFLKIFEASNRPSIGFEDAVAGREARIGGGA